MGFSQQRNWYDTELFTIVTIVSSPSFGRLSKEATFEVTEALWQQTRKRHLSKPVDNNGHFYPAGASADNWWTSLLPVTTKNHSIKLLHSTEQYVLYCPPQFATAAIAISDCKPWSHCALSPSTRSVRAKPWSATTDIWVHLSNVSQYSTVALPVCSMYRVMGTW